MREWLDAQFAAGLPAFSGTSISGTVAVKQDLLNELLSKWLAETVTPRNTSPPIDINRAKTFVRSATVRAEAGTVLVDFTIAV